MKILDGKEASQAIKDSLASKIKVLISANRRPPHLAAILIGNNGASETYVASKIKNCADIGFKSSLIRLHENASQEELASTILQLNIDKDIDGILVQLPLPKHINEAEIINIIDPGKDVDGFHPINAGRMLLGQHGFIPATPFGIMLLLNHYEIPMEGKHAVVIGRSNIVGRPMATLLSQNNKNANCTVTLCHSKTKNLKEICLQADVIIAALGMPGFLKANMVKEGAVIVDVGITRVTDALKKSGFTLKGDVDFELVSKKANYISPVPGGVGPMTIAALLLNTFAAYEKNVAGQQ
ncbi:MAG: bifunctional methylenetetrahydrofolate dehydrogenase/methenyltetrahydrofolate cyclohydrolase FolD [Ferruginibacter sp.]